MQATMALYRSLAITASQVYTHTRRGLTGECDAGTTGSTSSSWARTPVRTQTNFAIKVFASPTLVVASAAVSHCIEEGLMSA